MRKKIRKDGLHDLGPDDLLSRLSDDILVSILSRLPIKYVVATSVLSRRWRHLWRQTVRLDFEDKERWNKIHFDRVAARNGYVKWVNRIIRQHKGPTIEEFKICFNLAKTVKRAVDRWIGFAISKNVQRLELNLLREAVFRRGRNYPFPDKIFARKCEPSSNRSSFNIPVRPNATDMEIKFLKALILNCVDVNDEGLKKILSNCPVLEHLSIHGSCELLKAKIHGKGLALKKLEIMYCERLESVEICDSNIVSFNCMWSGSISYRLENLEKLENVLIHDYITKMKPIFFQISCNIPYLQVLELRIYYSQEDIQVSTLPKLLKLKQLIVEVYDGELSMLTSMVEACPNLHRFKVKVKYWMPTTSGLLNKVAKQPHQHLEEVEIDEYSGRNGDLELAMYFIENSDALKRLVIKPYKQIYGHTTKLVEENNAARDRAQQQLEPKTTPVGVELVMV